MIVTPIYMPMMARAEQLSKQEDYVAAAEMTRRAARVMRLFDHSEAAAVEDLAERMLAENAGPQDDIDRRLPPRRRR